MLRPEPRLKTYGLRLVLLALAAAFAVGCAGIRPNPQYNRDRHGKRPSKPRATQQQTRPESTTKPSPGGIGGDALDREVQRWWGTPYRLGGNKCEIGVDCSAYVQAVFKAVYGVKLPRTTGEQWRVGRPVSPGALRRGDLVFFNTSGRGVSHVGIYLGRGKFTHASNSDGVTINDLSDSYYHKRYLGARRVR